MTRTIVSRHSSPAFIYEYLQCLKTIGRLQNFRHRIYSFKMQRFDLLYNRDIFSSILESIHKDSFKFEIELSNLELDLDRTSKLLGTFNYMEKSWLHAHNITLQAKKDKQKAEMNHCGVWEDVRESQDKLSLLHEEMKGLLRTKALLEKKLNEMSRALEVQKENHVNALGQYKGTQSYVTTLKYLMPGSIISTRLFGQCYIISYRLADDMVMLQLPFGTSGKGYFYYKELVDYEKSIQINESKLMELEDQAMKTIVKNEKLSTKKECYNMQREEEAMRLYNEFHNKIVEFEAQKHEIIDSAVQESYLISESGLFNRKQRKIVNEAVKKLVLDRKERRKEYIGPQSAKPKLMSTYEIYMSRKKIERELKQMFVTKVWPTTPSSLCFSPSRFNPNLNQLLRL